MNRYLLHCFTKPDLYSTFKVGSRVKWTLDHIQRCNSGPLNYVYLMGFRGTIVEKFKERDGWSAVVEWPRYKPMKVSLDDIEHE